MRRSPSGGFGFRISKFRFLFILLILCFAVLYYWTFTLAWLAHGNQEGDNNRVKVDNKVGDNNKVIEDNNRVGDDNKVGDNNKAGDNKIVDNSKVVGDICKGVEFVHVWPDGKAPHTPPTDFPLTFITMLHNWDQARSNLFRSLAFSTPGNEWLIYDNSQGTASSITLIYECARLLATHSLVVYLHPDIFLPNEWQETVKKRMRTVESTLPAWGMLCMAAKEQTSQRVFGSWCDYTICRERLPKEDAARILKRPIYFACDEALILLRRDNHSWDLNLPGFDCFSIDMGLELWRKGLMSYVLNAKTYHKLFCDGGTRLCVPDDNSEWLRLRDDVSKRRELMSIDYVERKWKPVLPQAFPIHGTVYDIPVSTKKPQSP